MRPSFQPRLINDPFSDPGLFIPFRFEKRALAFDMGDMGRLSARDLLKISHVFVTHAHMDHFIGFDSLLRICLGREKRLHLYGPPGFSRHVKGKLAGYTWNLVDEFTNQFIIEVTEVHPERMLTARFACRDAFRPEGPPLSSPFSQTLLREPAFSVNGVLLDHRTPCLGLALVENRSVNIIRQGLDELGLPVGPWLNRFKSAVRREKNPGEEFAVTWKENGRAREKRFPLGELTQKIARITPGKKIAYITDVVGSPENRRKIVDLVRDADILFVEAAFLDKDREIARKKYHLTAGEAGELAALAGAGRFELFHFSPRYHHRARDFEREALAAYEKKKAEMERIAPLDRPDQP